MRTVLISATLSVLVFGTVFSSPNTHKAALPPYLSNGFFVSYYSDEIFGTGDLEMIQNYYGCAVDDLTESLSLCDTNWVLQWWEPENPSILSIPEILEEFEYISGVTVTPNFRYETTPTPDEPFLENVSPFAEPNDSLFPCQWHLQEDHLDMLNAWGRSCGDDEVVIGILDTGVWFCHEDLIQNLWINSGEDLNGDGIIQRAEVNGIDDDYNSYVDDFFGWDWMDEDNDARHPVDDYGFHGTKVAGVACASTNNHIGVAGVAWNCRYVPLRAGSHQGLYLEHIVPAMLYAIEKRIDVLNCSWYNYYNNEILAKLTECLYEQGTVVVACAGNNCTYLPAYPASYDWVVAVAATDQEKTLASFSNYGCWVHLAAPGVSILTTTAYEDSARLYPIYSYKEGTSFSAPMVSAAAALLRSVRPGWSPAQIIERLYRSADPLSIEGNPPDRTIDGGVLNVHNALNIPVVDIDPEVPFEQD